MAEGVLEEANNGSWEGSAVGFVPPRALHLLSWVHQRIAVVAEMSPTGEGGLRPLAQWCLKLSKTVLEGPLGVALLEV